MKPPKEKVSITDVAWRRYDHLEKAKGALGQATSSIQSSLTRFLGVGLNGAGPSRPSPISPTLQEALH